MYLLKFLILFQLVWFISCYCCYGKNLTFRTSQDRKCSEFEKAKFNGPLSNERGIYCIVKVCADGRKKRGQNCGSGEGWLNGCNFFGCNCDYGCHGGAAEPKDSFKKLYGNAVWDVKYEWED